MERELWVKTATVLPLFNLGKKLEVRINGGSAAKIRVGDILHINLRIRRRVISIRMYRNFDSMLRIENPRHIHPDMDHDDLLQFMRSFCTPKRERKGVLVFELEEV